MFGCSSKIEELKKRHQLKVDELIAENNILKERIQELEKPAYVEDTKKDEFGGHMIRVRGSTKVIAHLIFAILALTDDQLLKFVQ